jgi:hypothetical protein
MCLSHRVFEGSQVHLAQRAFADLHVRGESFGFEVVGDIVLGGRPDTALLDAFDVGGSQDSGQDGVLAERFEVTTAER